jgi:hypothetical protein
MCALRFRRLFALPPFVPGVIGLVGLLISLRQPPDRTIGHPEVSPHLAQRHALRQHPSRLRLLLVDELGTPKAGTPMAQLYQSFNTWLQSGSTTMPSLVQSKLDERIAFNTIVVIVSSILLVVCVALSTFIWSTLIKRSRVREAKWRLQERAFVVSGVATVALSLLMLVVFAKYL